VIDDGSVLLGYIHAGDVRAEFMRSVLDVTAGPDADRKIGGVLDATAGSLIAKARNLLVQQFLSTAREWLWMVDTDVVFSQRALPLLAEIADAATSPVVTGVVQIVKADGTRFPSVFSLDVLSPGGMRIEPLPMAGWPRSESFTVDACGAACLLVHRSVFAKIAAGDGPVWFLPIEVDNGLVGEDVSFCMRAGAVGARPVVAARVLCGHVKPVVIGSIA